MAQWRNCLIELLLYAFYAIAVYRIAAAAASIKRQSQREASKNDLQAI